MGNLINKRTQQPFRTTFERKEYERPLPQPLTVLKWAVFCFVVVGLLLYVIAMG